MDCLAWLRNNYIVDVGNMKTNIIIMIMTQYLIYYVLHSQSSSGVSNGKFSHDAYGLFIL